MFILIYLNGKALRFQILRYYHIPIRPWKYQQCLQSTSHHHIPHNVCDCAQASIARGVYRWTGPTLYPFMQYILGGKIIKTSPKSECAHANKSSLNSPSIYI